MWFEVLPSYLVIFTAMSLGMSAGGWVMAAAHDKPFMKSLKTNFQVQTYMRDWRLTGDPYKPQGLEAIKDEDEGKC